jgi:hypothetical protein
MIEQITLQTRLKFPNQRVIIDHMNSPYVAVGVGSGSAAGELGEGSPAVPATEFEVPVLLGESDLKWVRYLPFGNIILDAIDSDYVQIALLQIERLGSAAPRIYVRRLLLEPSNAVVSAVAGGSGKKKSNAKSKKRPLDQFLEPSGDDPEPTSAVDSATTSDAVVKKGRVYEYCDCNIVFKGMHRTFGHVTPQELKPYTLRLISYCVALVGCDFTKGVSWFNGTAAFKNMQILWPGMCRATIIDKDTGVLSMDPRIIADDVIGVLWKKVQFVKLCGSAMMQNADFETLYEFLSTHASVSAFRRDRLITPKDLCCLAKGSNWTLLYWYDCENCPCSVYSDTDYGFKCLKVGGKTEFDDDKPLPSRKQVRAKVEGKIIKWG